jgi:hypothetical protein
VGRLSIAQSRRVSSSFFCPEDPEHCSARVKILARGYFVSTLVILEQCSAIQKNLIFLNSRIYPEQCSPQDRQNLRYAWKVAENGLSIG